MIFFVTGASGSGKTACMPHLRRLLPHVVVYDFDTVGVPPHAGAAWRQQTTEYWLQQVLAHQRDLVIRSSVVGRYSGKFWPVPLPFRSMGLPSVCSIVRMWSVLIVSGRVAPMGPPKTCSIGLRGSGCTRWIRSGDRTSSNDKALPACSGRGGRRGNAAPPVGRSGYWTRPSSRQKRWRSGLQAGSTHSKRPSGCVWTCLPCAGARLTWRPHTRMAARSPLAWRALSTSGVRLCGLARRLTLGPSSAPF